MKNKKNTYFLILLLFFSTNLLAQNETKIWYFGNKAGLNFNTEPPTILTNGQINTYEGCSSISDSDGNLLFYTDGNTIWNKTHAVMDNGSGLLGGQGSSSQSSIIIKKPCSNTEYYVFINGALNNTIFQGLSYSIVDIGLSSGNGSVTVKNYTLCAPTTEKLSAVKHSNGIDTWVLTHDWNSNNFRTYLVSSSGINLVPVLSSIGTIHNSTNSNIGVGCIKISPNGKKIGVGIDNYTTGNPSLFELYDFNNTNGVVTNSLTLGTFTSAYGCEFSPDNSKFYGTDFLKIQQWDLSVTNPTAIISSIKTVATSTVTFFASMQLAPNGKIYVARASSYLGVINNPNNLGSLCNFVELGQSVVITSYYGLPNFSAGYFNKYPVLNINTGLSFSMCVGETKTLNATGALTYTWNGSLVSSSTTINPILNTTYSISGTSSAGCVFSETVAVSVSPCLNINIEAQGKLITIYPNPAQSFVKLELANMNEIKEVRLLNYLGLTILSHQNESSEKEIELNISQLPNGVYYIVANAVNNERIYKKALIIIN